MTARVDHAVTSGTFSLDGQTYDVDNNVWVVGDDEECVVIDAPHDVEEAFARMKSGDILRSVVIVDPTAPTELGGTANSPATDQVDA